MQVFEEKYTDFFVAPQVVANRLNYMLNIPGVRSTSVYYNDFLKKLSAFKREEILIEHSQEFLSNALYIRV